MATEIEVKYRLDDPPQLRRALELQGAEHRSFVLETNRFYDWPDRRIRGQGCSLRTRVAQPITPGPEFSPVGEPASTVTYKGPVQPGAMKVREELEFGADNAETVGAMFAAMGMAERFSFEKRRDTWVLGDCEIVLDEAPGLGHFAEIEGASEQAVAAAAERLGMADTPVERGTYRSMLGDLLKQIGSVERTVTFETPFSPE